MLIKSTLETLFRNFLPLEIIHYIYSMFIRSVNEDICYHYKAISENMASGLCERTLSGHTKWVSCASMFMGSDGDPRIVSGSWDNTLKVWSAESGLCERTLSGHTDWVNCVAVFMGSDGNPRLVSGSHDYTLKVWIL